MVDSTSDIGAVDPESAPDCATCGDRVLGDSHRVVTWIEDDRVEHRHFCDEACLTAWRDESA